MTMFYTYILQSEKLPTEYYVGSMSDLRQRVADHNEGKQRYTRGNQPWKLVWYGGFPEKHQAAAFEKYLKSGSGHAFRKRRPL